MAHFFSSGNWYVIERTPRKKQDTVGIDQGLLYVPFWGVTLDITFTYVDGLKMMGFSPLAFVMFKAGMCHETQD